MAGTFSPPLAAITTVFTPPCPTTWILTSTKVPSQYPPFPTAAPASCDPPSWDAYLSQRGFAYYSPAICPDGFYVGPSCIVDNPRTGEGFPAIQAGETAAYCVPSGHTCTSDVTDFRGGVWGVTRTATVTGAQATFGPAIQIRWRAGDLGSLETDPLTPGPRATTSSLILPSTPALPLPLPSSIDEIESTVTRQETIILEPPSRPFSPSSSSPSSRPSSPSSSSSSSSLAGSTLTPKTSLPPLSSSTSDLTTATSSSNPSQNGQPAKSQGISDGAQKGQDNAPGSGSGSSTFTTATIVLTVILITILAVYGAWAMLNRYRRHRAGETTGTGTGTGTETGTELFVFQVEAWARRLLLRLSRNGATTTDDDDDDDNDRLENEDEKGRRRKLPDAELGTDGPLPELADTKPFGTKENPAELPSATQERISIWRERVSRVSRMFTKHMSAP